MAFERSSDPDFDIRPMYLAWMCLQVIKNADQWSIDKQHRWVGHVSGCIRCNGLNTLAGEREKVRTVRELPEKKDGFWKRLFSIRA